VTIVILVITGLTAVAYLMYRNRQKKKLAIGIFQDVSTIIYDDFDKVAIKR